MGVMRKEYNIPTHTHTLYYMNFFNSDCLFWDLLNKAEQRSKELFGKQMNKYDEVGTAITNLEMIDFNELSINQTITILLDIAQKISIVE